ncbi:MAG: metal-dependent hydrolase [Thermoplasmata archaeon]|nr:MAG: metal-dependent hydrolase [Thermoplasmata archaeon]
MDFFTHIVFSYLLNIGLDSPNFIFGIGVGILPDMDLLWSPLGKKYYWAKHRALTHSVGFIILLALVCSLIASTFWPLNFWELLPFALLTGMAHIAVDLITTSGIPILLPFSSREFKFEVDKAVNPYIMAFSFSTIIFLNYLGRISYPYSTYLVYATIITLGFVVYYIIKVIIKFWLVRKYSTPELRFDVLPTSGLFVWYLVNKVVKKDRYSIKYARFNLLRSSSIDFKTFSYEIDEDLKPPVNEREKVKSYTYNLKEVQNYFKKFKYPIAEVIPTSSSDRKWVVFWYPLELIMLNRTSALRVDLSENGTYSARRTFFLKCNENNI